MSNLKEFGIEKLKDLTDGEAAGYTNAREKFDAVELKQLAADIADNGLLQPIVVWVTKDESGKEIKVRIDGARREKAIQMLLDDGDTTFKAGVPVRYVEAADIKEARYKALSGNIQREALTGYELAQEVHRLKEMGDDQKTIASKLHKSEPWVSRKVRTFEHASSDLKKAWMGGKFADEIVERLAKIDDEEKQAEAVEEALKEQAKGGKGSRGATRKKVNARANKVERASLKEMQQVLVYAEHDDAHKEDEYLRGVYDALRFATGAATIRAFDAKWREHMEAVEADMKAKKKEAEKESAARSKKAVEAAAKNGAKTKESRASA